MSTTTTTATAGTASNNTTATLAAKQNSFYVIAREHGKFRNDLPLWASKESDPFQLKKKEEGEETTADDGGDSSSCAAIRRQEVEGVPGAFQILNVFSKEETKRMVDKFEELGFTEDAAVSLPRSVRHNQNLNWIADDTTLEVIWDRCKHYFMMDTSHFLGEKKPLGLNGKFRIYKYEANDYFKWHTDGSWPGSRNVGGKFVQNSYDDDRWSMYTFLIYLTDDYDGGKTEFLVNKIDPTKPARHFGEAETKAIRTPQGGVLCFPHGEHPLHCLHASSTITEGIKYIIRSDVLFEV